MCMSNIFSENIPWSIGLIVVLFGIIAAHRLVSYRDKKNAFNKAADIFRSYFVDEQHAIQRAISSGEGDQGYFLMMKIHTDATGITLEKAKIMFEPYISATELVSFNAAWENYIEWPRYFHGQCDNKEKTHEMLRHLGPHEVCRPKITYPPSAHLPDVALHKPGRDCLRLFVYLLLPSSS